MSSIGNRIREQRIALGLSVDELAERLRKNRATVYRYERNEIENLPISVIAPLSEILQVSPTFLMGWHDKKPVAENGNGHTEEFIKLFCQLSSEQQSLIVAQIKGILSKR